MTTEEQPPKKRKLQNSPPPPPSHQPPHPPPPPHTPPPLSPDELQRRRRNQEEIRNVHDNCKTIKRCLSSGKDPRHLPDLEQSYLSLLSASRGCISVQRILSKFIPPYASYCPTALEAAAQVVINMHNWNEPLISRGEDVDGVSFEIAKNCIAGLVDICCTASREAPSSSVIQGICSVVFLNAATFFVSSVEGKSIFEIIDKESCKMQDCSMMFEGLKQQILCENAPPLLKLLKFRALCLLRIFFLCPKDVLSACFELFGNRAADGFSSEGTYFLNQLCGDLSPLGYSEVCGENEGPEASTYSMRVDAEHNDGGNGSRASDHGHYHRNKTGLLKCCLLGLVLHRDPSLRKWLFSRYKRLQKSASFEVISQVTSAFQETFESFVEEAEDAEDPDDQVSDSTKYVRSQVHGLSNQHMHYESSGNSSSPLLHEKSFKDDLAKKSSGQHVRHNSSSDPHPNTSSTYDSGCSRCMDFDSNEDGDKAHGWLPVPKDRRNAQLLSPLMENSAQMSDTLEQRDRAVQYDNNQASNLNDFQFSSSSAVNAVYGSNPSLSCPSTSNQIVWYSDGDPAAMEVFSATRQLWLGSLSPDVFEAALRFELERFGPIENFMFVSVRGFALVEYISIFDAIKAREYFRRSFPWGYPVRVKFVDVGLGTRGAVNSVAIGISCHVFVGNVMNQWVKDEIVRETMKAVCRGPRLVTELTSEAALLLEFETPVEAARAMACIRQFRRGNISFPAAVAHPVDTSTSCPNFWNSGYAPVGGILGSMSSSFLGSPHGQPAASPSNRIHNTSTPFKMNPGGTPQEFASPRAIFEQRSIALSGQMAPPNMSASLSRDTPVTSGQAWSHQNSEFEMQSAGENLTCTSIATQGSTVALPQSTHLPPYTQHGYPPANSSWDARSFTNQIPLNTFSPHAMPSSVHSNLAPFAQSSVTPMSQIPASGNEPYNQMLPHPSLPTPLPQPSLQPLVPPSPPSGPPPASPPPPPPPPPAIDPAQSTTPSSSSISAVGGVQLQWQGSLSKSGVHFCNVYARRLDAEFCKYSISLSEPAGWPSKLDMTKRTDFSHVRATYTNTSQKKREVCELLPSSAADHKGFQDFISYLKQRGCAGVIKIPSMKPLWARLLFILPCSQEVCSMLSINPDATDCLLAVVLPKEANTDCAS